MPKSQLLYLARRVRESSQEINSGGDFNNGCQMKVQQMPSRNDSRFSTNAQKYRSRSQSFANGVKFNLWNNNSSHFTQLH